MAAPALQARYSDVVSDATGRPVGGATVSLYPVRRFAPGVLPASGTVPAQPPLAVAMTDATGAFSVEGLTPDDYHVLVQYAPVGAAPQTLWRYNVAIGPHEETRRAAAHGLGAAIPRTLARLLGGLPTTILCVGDEVTVGYNATGAPQGGWVARLATNLAVALPTARVTRYDPTGYATTLDGAIPSWTALALQQGAGPAAQQVSVINAGVTGDTVLRALRRVGNLTAASWSPPPDCYIVSLGLGEMSADPTRAVGAADIGGQLSGLVNVLRGGASGGGNGGAEVLLCTPHAGPPGANPDDYAAAVRAVAAATGCGVIDLRGLWQDHLDPAAANDGYGAWLDSSAGNHTRPTDAGHAAIGDEVFRAFDPSVVLPVAGLLGVGATWEHVRLLNTSALLTMTGSWTAYGGGAEGALLASPRELQTTTPGDRVTLVARCSELYMLCRRWRDGGRVTVIVDGAALGVVDLYRGVPASTVDVAGVDAAMAPQERVALALGLSDTAHTITLQLSAASNPSSQGTAWRFDALELLRLRQGGLAVEGTEPLQRVQRGTATVALTGAPTGTATTTFPIPYAGAPPAVIAQSPNPAYYTVVTGVGATGATLTLVQYAHMAVTDTQQVSWLAFG